MTSVSSFRGPTHRDLLVSEVADRLKMESDIIIQIPDIFLMKQVNFCKSLTIDEELFIANNSTNGDSIQPSV